MTDARHYHEGGWIQPVTEIENVSDRAEVVLTNDQAVALGLEYMEYIQQRYRDLPPATAWDD